MTRNDTKEIHIGNKTIGAGNPVLIQSMTNTRTEDVSATVAQIKKLEEAGCDIIRCAVPDFEAAKAIKEIRKSISIPLVADIHFDSRLAVAAIEAGADKVRINPGNIGSREKVHDVVRAAADHGIPIRIGVNSGSVEQSLLKKYGGVCAAALCESALSEVRTVEDMNFDDIVVSIKASDVMMCVEANRMFSEQSCYPLHIGITESGTLWSGNIKSSVGLALILGKGIGDTIRVSLTGDPAEEIRTAKLILRTLGLKKGGVEIVSCPTCGRTNIDLEQLAGEVEKLASSYPYDIKIAVMGCAVNGPGEARESDIGVAGGKGEGLVFKKGVILKKVPESEIISALKNELDHWNDDK